MKSLMKLLILTMTVTLAAPIAEAKKPKWQKKGNPKATASQGSPSNLGCVTLHLNPKQVTKLQNNPKATKKLVLNEAQRIQLQEGGITFKKGYITVSAKGVHMTDPGGIMALCVKNVGKGTATSIKSIHVGTK
jgi:hypothetical protein